MSTDIFRRYLDLLNEAETRVKLVANQPVIPGQPLSSVQMAVVDIARSMGNQMGPEVDRAYDLAKQAGVRPGPVIRDRTDSDRAYDLAKQARVKTSSGVTTNNRSETSNILKNLIKPRADSGNYIDPKTGIIMYVPIKSPKAGFDAPDPDPKPLTLKLLNQPEAQEIKNALRAAGLDIISVDKPSLFGSYPVAAVDPDKLAQALAATGSNNDSNELVPPNTNVALPSSGTFSNDQALANLAAKIKANKAAVQRFEPTDSNTDSAESLELLRQLRELGQQISNLPDAINSTDIEAGLAEIKNDTAIAGKMTSLLKQLAALPETSVSYITRKEALDIIEASRDKIIRRSKAVEAKVQQGVKDAARSSGSVAPTGGGATPTGGGSTSPSGGGSSTPTGVQDGPGLAGGQRCAVCGTPKMDHSNLTHQFQPGGDTRPAPVPQGGSGGGADVSRIKQLQRDLIAAGAKNLGTTGPNHDGVDGDIGSRTREAMQKYPDVAVKYADLNASQGSTPDNIKKLNAALTAIEGILDKYKVKLKENINHLAPTDQMKQWRSLMELTQADMDAAAAKRKTAQASNQSKINAQSAADAQAKKIGPYYSDAPAQAAPYTQAAQRPWAGTGSAAEQGAASTAAEKGAATAASTAAEKGAATAASTAAGKSAAGVASKTLGRVAPGVGLALGAYDAYDRAKQGDYTGAGISGLAGIAALFPGPGTWISGGLLALGLARDLTKSPTVAITAEDAKIIADNIKIIQDWQKDPANQAALTPELKNRIANVLKGVASVGVPTAQAATPATPASAPAPAPASAPAATPAVNPKVNQINQTLDSMDQLLKKNKYESISNKKSPPLTEAERMARLRDIVTEDFSDWVTNALTGYGGYKAWQAAKDWRAGAAPPPAGAAPAAAAGSPSWLAKLNKGLSMVWKTGLFTTKWGLIAAGAAAMAVLWDTFKENPEVARAAGINPDDMKQFAELNTQLQQIIGDEASFKALPPEVQQKATDIAKRSLSMAAGIATRKSREPEPP